MAEEQGRHFCACGCGQAIEVKKRHRAKGIPKFVHGHQCWGPTAFVRALNAEVLVTIAQAARELGVCETTLRRAEEQGWVEPERRAWGEREPMRVYREIDLPAVRTRLVEAGFRPRRKRT